MHRRSFRAQKWSKEIRERDGNKCKNCGKTGNLHAHHIIAWNFNEELRFDLSNGITLCGSCHGKIEGYRKNHVFSEETKKKISESKKGQTSWNAGKKLTSEHKQKLRIAKIGHIPWNKGIRTENPETRICSDCNVEKIITDFTASTGGWYKHRCKQCRNAKLKKKRDEINGNE